MTLIHYQTLWRADCHPQNAQCAISNTILLELSIKFLLVAFHMYATLDLGCSTSQLESCVARSDGFVQLSKTLGSQVLETVLEAGCKIWHKFCDRSEWC